MNSKILCCLLICNSLIINALQSQNTTWATHFGSGGIEKLNGLRLAQNGTSYCAGTFSNDLTIGSNPLIINGLEDIFLAKFDPNGTPLWATQGGSLDRDEVAQLLLFQDSIVFLTGIIWDDATFGNLTLNGSGSAVFVLRYDENGSPIWAATVRGNGTKRLHDATLDAQGNLLLTGAFSGDLHFPSDTLTAQGVQDFFLAKFDANGQFLWAVRAGFQEQTIGTGVATLPNGDAWVVGQFNGRVAFANDTLWASSLDFDLFLAKYAADGSLQFARRLGGIYDDTAAKIQAMSNGDLLLSGTFIGQLFLDATPLQTFNFTSDVFLARFNGNGQTLWSQQFGGNNNDFSTSLTVRNDEILLSGYFFNSTDLNGEIFTTTAGNFQNFTLRMTDNNGQRLTETYSFSSTMSSFATLSDLQTNGNLSQILLGGTFQGSINLPIAMPSPISNGFSDVYLVQLQDFPVTTRSFFNPPAEVHIFPNPTANFCWVEIKSWKPMDFFELQVIDYQGVIVKKQSLTASFTQVHLTDLPAGFYIFQIFNNRQNVQNQKVLFLK